MMLHAIKTPAALTACLVIAAACSSGADTQLDTLSSAPAVIADSYAPKASPVDLDLLALLATRADTETTVAHTLPTVGSSGVASGWYIVPAKTVTYELDAPIPLTIEPQINSRSLPVVTPGTYRTVEYKS